MPEKVNVFLTPLLYCILFCSYIRNTCRLNNIETARWNFSITLRKLFFTMIVLFVFQKKIPATTFEHYDTLHLHSNVPHLSFRDFTQKRGRRSCSLRPAKIQIPPTLASSEPIFLKSILGHRLYIMMMLA